MFIDRTQELLSLINNHPKQKDQCLHHQQSTSSPSPSTTTTTTAAPQSVFIHTASAIRSEIDEISRQVGEIAKHFMRTWSSTTSASHFSADPAIISTANYSTTMMETEETPPTATQLEQKLKSISRHITELEQVLSRAENDQPNRSSKANHQLAHYHSIIISLYALIQQVSNQLKVLRTLEAQRALYAQKLFMDQPQQWTTTTTTDDKNKLSSKQKEKNEMREKRLMQLQNEQQLREEEERSKLFVNKTEEEQSSSASSSQSAITASQLLLLQSENSWLQEEIEQWLNDALEAEKSAVALGELISLFDQKVSEQAEQIELLYESAKNSEEAISDAARELEKAKLTSQGKSEGGASWLVRKLGGKVLANLIRYFVFYLLIGASLFLLFMDLISR